MSNYVTVMNWFFGITAGLMVLTGISFLIYAKVKRQKIEKVPVSFILQIGYAGCAIAIMNLRDRQEGLAMILAAVQVILLAISGPMVWKRFVRHLRNEGLLSKPGLQGGGASGNRGLQNGDSP